MEIIRKNEYATVTNESLRACIAFLQNCDPASLSNGRHTVTDDIYCNVMEYNSKEVEGDVFETHRVNVDVQVLGAGTEKIAIPQGEVKFSEYLEAKDNEPCTCDSRTYVTISAGDLCVFLTGEPHLPGLAVAESAPVKKLVFKIPRQLF